MSANPGALARFAGAELDKPTEQLKGVSASDDDLLVDRGPERSMSLFDLAAIDVEVAALLAVPVS
jgi:hypothetical protein